MKSKQIKARNKYQESINNRIIETKEYNELQEDVASIYPNVEPYTTSIPFDRTIAVKHTLVTSDTWTPNTFDPKDGCGAIYTIIADGSHSPTFTGFNKSTASGDFDTTLGVVNLITFLYASGYYWYSINQAQ